MLSKLTKKITATMMAFCYLLASEVAAETPRLFMALKGERIVFFLPLIHASSMAVRDTYLPTIIEPIFRRVSVMFEEVVPLAHIYPFALHPCGNDVPLLPKVQVALPIRKNNSGELVVALQDRLAVALKTVILQAFESAVAVPNYK